MLRNCIYVDDFTEMIMFLCYQVAENPYVYDGHTELIKYLREIGELDSLRDARQKMSELFPLSEGKLLYG